MAGEAGADGARARVFLHVGEPKTATTYIQDVLWGNRVALAAHGIHLPGTVPIDHWRAAQDLRQVQLLPDDPGGWGIGDWDRLAAEARGTPGTSVISSELLAAAESDRVRHAFTTLEPAEVHVVLTVRNLASLLPAEWQESVKHRSRAVWDEWVGRVIREGGEADRRRWWFWKVHDSVDILRTWAVGVPPDRIHVVTVPPAGSPHGEIWRRFAAVIGVDPEIADLAVARPNASLGRVEIETLRRLNEALPVDYPDWAYADWVKAVVAQQALSVRPSSPKPPLPTEAQEWVAKEAERTITGLLELGCRVVGDLDDLRPRLSDRPAQDRPHPEPGELFDAAVDGLAGLLVEIERQRRAEAESPRPLAKELLYQLAQRHPRVSEARLRYWRAVEAIRRERRRRGWSVTG